MSDDRTADVLDSYHNTTSDAAIEDEAEIKQDSIIDEVPRASLSKSRSKEKSGSIKRKNS